MGKYKLPIAYRLGEEGWSKQGWSKGELNKLTTTFYDGSGIMIQSSTPLDQWIEEWYEKHRTGQTKPVNTELADGTRGQYFEESGKEFDR